MIHRAQLDAPTNGINGKQAYEYIWNTSGTYMYSVEATKGSQSGRILKRLAVIVQLPGPRECFTKTLIPI